MASIVQRDPAVEHHQAHRRVAAGDHHEDRPVVELLHPEAAGVGPADAVVGAAHPEQGHEPHGVDERTDPSTGRLGQRDTVTPAGIARKKHTRCIQPRSSGFGGSAAVQHREHSVRRQVRGKLGWRVADATA